MPAVCDRLGVHPDAPPDPTTFYHSFDRYAMYVWRALLRISAQQYTILFNKRYPVVCF